MLLPVLPPRLNLHIAEVGQRPDDIQLHIRTE